ncbi:MAG: Crp/Fnr family transcriptional regulator [Bacteroidota bacterium]
MKRISVPKGQILQRSGERNTKVYYVRSGLLRSYSIDEKGKEHIFMFAPEGWIIGDNIPPEEPSMLFIEALEPSEVIVNEKNIEKESNPKKLIARIAVLQKRIIQLMSSPAIERYEDFMATYPNVSQRVPQRMIASYLGITPEALSKLKRERNQKQ